MEPSAWESDNMGISFGQTGWHPSYVLACISIETAWKLHSSLTHHRLQEMQPVVTSVGGVGSAPERSDCMGPN